MAKLKLINDEQGSRKPSDTVVCHTDECVQASCIQFDLTCDHRAPPRSASLVLAPLRLAVNARVPRARGNAREIRVPRCQSAWVISAGSTRSTTAPGS